MDNMTDEIDKPLPAKKRYTAIPMEEIYENLIGFEDEEHTSQKTLLLNNRNKIVMRRHDPYGFITVHFGKGKMPDRLQGEFTSYHDAEKFVMSYLKSNDIQVINASDVKTNPQYDEE